MILSYTRYPQLCPFFIVQNHTSRFQTGCTELNYVYEHDGDFAAFPTFPIVLGFKGTNVDIVDFPSEFMKDGPKNPPFKGVVTGVDGERSIEMLNPVPTDGSSSMAMKSAIGKVFFFFF